MYTYISGQLISSMCSGGYYNLLNSSMATVNFFLHAKAHAYDAIRPSGPGVEFAPVQYDPYIQVALTQDSSAIAVRKIVMSGEPCRTITIINQYYL